MTNLGGEADRLFIVLVSHTVSQQKRQFVQLVRTEDPKGK